VTAVLTPGIREDEPKAAESPTPFLAWPGWNHLGYTLLLSLPNTLWFMLVFGGMDLLTARRSFRVRVHLSAELGIPLVPAMTVFYMSIYLVFLAAPFIVRRRHQVRALVGTLALVIFCAGIGFLLFPADLAFPAPEEAELGRWAGIFHLADKLNLTYNLVPSLHVALVVACVSVYSARASAQARFLLWSWAAMIAASTILTHQHHVLDVVTGWLLALGCVKLAFPRLAAMKTGHAPRLGLFMKSSKNLGIKP
jgi:membrane-associated phospholipid phosphatase